MLRPLSEDEQKKSDDIKAFVRQHKNIAVGYGLLFGDFTEDELRSAGVL